MYQGVELVCIEHQDAWNGILAFVQTFQLFVGKLSVFKQKAYLHTNATIGVREVKDVERANVVKKAQVIASALRSLSSLQSDVKLNAQLRFSYTRLMQCNATRLQQYLDTIMDVATAHIEDLPDYGITQAKLDELQLLRNQLEQTLLTTRNAIVVRKSLTAELELLSREIDQLLKVNLDQLMLVIGADDPEFYRQYQAARLIVDHKGKTSKPKPPLSPNTDA